MENFDELVKQYIRENSWYHKHKHDPEVKEMYRQNAKKRYQEKIDDIRNYMREYMDRDWTCDKCNKTLRIGSKSAHMKSCGKEKPPPTTDWTCDKCNKTMKKTSKSLHLKTCGLSKEDLPHFTCEKCNKYLRVSTKYYHDKICKGAWVADSPDTCD